MTTLAHKRMRLDALLVERDVVPSLARAQAAILAGEVYVNGMRADKAGMPVAEDAAVELRSSRPAFAGRGGSYRPEIAGGVVPLPLGRARALEE